MSEDERASNFIEVTEAPSALYFGGCSNKFSKRMMFSREVAHFKAP